jgi:hypothetical protein
MLLVEKPPYTNARFPEVGKTIRSQSRRLSIADGESAAPITIPMSKGGVLAGRVLDPGGEPVEHANVEALMLPAAGGHPQQRGGASTNDLGEFRLAHLEAGRYLLLVVPRYLPQSQVDAGDAGAPGEAEEAQPLATFYPGVSAIDQAQPITIARDQSIAGIDLTMIERVPATVRGVVVDAAGQPVTCCGSVSARPLVEGGTWFAGINGTGIRQDGSFQLKLAAGEYELVANVMPRAAKAPPSPGSEQFGRLTLSVGGDMSGVTVMVGKGARISGRIVLDGDGPPPVAANPNVSLVAFVGGADGSMCRPGHLELNPDLTFTIDGVSGTCVPTPESSLGNWRVRSIQYNGRELIDQPTSLEPGQELRDVRVVLSDRRAGLSVHATDDTGAPTSDFIALVMPADKARRIEGSSYFRAIVLPLASTRSNAPDAASPRVGSLSGMLPGDYLVIALDDVDLDWQRDLALVETLAPFATHVQIADGPPAEVTLRRMRLADLVPRR